MILFMVLFHSKRDFFPVFLGFSLHEIAVRSCDLHALLTLPSVLNTTAASNYIENARNIQDSDIKSLRPFSSYGITSAQVIFFKCISPPSEFQVLCLLQYTLPSSGPDI